MSNKLPAFQFYPGDWRRDSELHMMTFQSRGIWIEILCLMWDAQNRGKLHGTVEPLSRMIGCTILEMETCLRELISTKAGDVFVDSNVTCNANVTFCNNDVTVCNRRMRYDETEREATRYRVSNFRKRKCNANVTFPSSSSSSSSIKKEERKEEKKAPSAAPLTGTPIPVEVSSQKKNGSKPENETIALLKAFGKAYEEKMAVPYCFNWGRDGKAAKNLLQVYNFEGLLLAIREFFVMQDNFFEEQGRTWGCFAGSFNKIASRTNKKINQGVYHVGA